MCINLRLIGLTAMVCLFGLGGIGRAELQPSEIFLVYNRNLPASRELAEYYMKKRGVPTAQSIGLDLPLPDKTDNIEREAYLTKVRVPLRGWLRHENLQDKIRCLVTVYGVPLRIAGTGVTKEDKPLLKEVNAELDTAMAAMEGLIAALEKFAPQPAPANSPAVARFDPAKRLAYYEALRAKAVERVGAAKNPQEAAALTKGLGELLQRGNGLAVIASHLEGGDEAGRQTIAAMQASLAQQRSQLKMLLADCPRSPKRRETHQMLASLFGLHGLITHLQEDQVRLEGNETQAALDSELSLLWWDDYPLYRWVLNPMCWRLRHSAEFASMSDPRQMAQSVVMVARLDGPGPAIVRRMIDDAIATEETGLEGTIYIDARGLKAAPSGYGEYDQDLRDLAKLLAKTALPVVLDDKPELFAAGQCRDAALYCGWYSLGKYVDAFQWNRGAVAFHIASSEAVSLHDPAARYWCKRMLDEGVAGTLGPVAEPYLSSFPRPRDFFGLLLTGQYTLAECYYHTINFHSWMQTLLGDPLYMPYRKHPRLKVQDVFPAEWLTEPAATQPVAASPRANR